MKDNEHVYLFTIFVVVVVVTFKRCMRLRVNFCLCNTCYGLTNYLHPPSMTLFSLKIILSQLLRKIAQAKLGVGWLQGPHFPGKVCRGFSMLGS